MKRSNSSLHGAQSKTTGPAHASVALQAELPASIIERAKWLATIDASLRRCLAPELAQQCQLANIDQHRLVMLVSSPVWKSKLRLESQRVLTAAAELGLKTDVLVIKVMQSLPSQATETSAPLSKAARDALQNAANSVADPELRAQLLALASVAENQSQT